MSDGRLEWGVPDRDQTEGTQDVTAEFAAADSQLGPITEAEQALIAANLARIEDLKTLPQGADELELGDLLRIVSPGSGAEVGLSVAGLALQVAGLVPITLWESVAAAAGAAGLALRTTHHGRAHELVLAGAEGADDLWRSHPEFVIGANR